MRLHRAFLLTRLPEKYSIYLGNHRTLKHSMRMTRETRRKELSEMSNEDLMALLQKGTEEALVILMERHEEGLSLYIRRFVGDLATTEDILQETWLRVYRNRHSYRRIALFSTWLYTIAGNLARSEYRKRKRRGRYGTESLTAMYEGEEYDCPIPVNELSPSECFESRMTGERIQEAFSMIPEEFREVVVLRDVQQLSYQEIAEITALPMGTVKSRINRGRTKLQHILAEHHVHQGKGHPGKCIPSPEEIKRGRIKRILRDSPHFRSGA